MTKDEIIERVARDAWQSFVHSVAWEELPRGYRQGCIVTATRILDAAGYFEIREAAEEAKREIEYWHDDYLTEEERMHPRGSGWARVYDKLVKALGGDVE